MGESGVLWPPSSLEFDHHHHHPRARAPLVLGLVQTKVIVPHSLTLRPHLCGSWRRDADPGAQPDTPIHRLAVAGRSAAAAVSQPASERSPAAPAAPGPRARARAPGGAPALGHPPNGRAQGLNVILL